MKIYVASSWRNESQPSVVEFLRAAGHEVYDFRHPVPGNEGFSWKQVWLERDDKGKSTLASLSGALAHPIAEQGFKYDFDAMKWAEVCVLVLPCGNSAHLEAGWMAGQGKLVLVYGAGQVKIEPELMYKFLDRMHDTLEGLGETLAKFAKHTLAPLSCDCYGGCWGDHSVAWSKITIADSSKRQIAFRACWETLKIPHGSYVLAGNELRLQTKEYKQWVEKFIETSPSLI